MNRTYIRGLTKEEAEASRKKYGPNEFRETKKKSLISSIMGAFNDPIIKILLGALAVNLLFSLGSMDMSESIGIVASVFISVTVSTLSEYGSEKAFEKLKNESQKISCRVIRSGRIEEISLSEITVGDAVIISSGEYIPADGYLIDGEIYVDQSALSGESKELKKTPSNERNESLTASNTLFRGTTVTSGNGILLVSSIGEDTCIGKIASDLGQDSRESPLKLRLSKLAKTISKIGYVMAGVTAFVYLYNAFVIDSGFVWQVTLTKICDVKYLLVNITNALSLAVTVIVVAVPEGLPMMICVVLSANMRKMLEDKILVKKLVGIETAGSMNILFCDKTGTLTGGRHSVERVVLASGNIISKKDIRKSDFLCNFTDACSKFNCECTFSASKAKGSNATDRAIAEYFFTNKKSSEYVIERIPFNSKYKFSAVKLSDGKIIIKGAPELILSHAESAYTADGRKVDFDISRVKKELEYMAGKSMRVIAIASAEKMPDISNMPSLTFVMLVGIKDSVRESAKGAVRKLKAAGIKVVMLTGDNRETAISVARECSIIENGKKELVITGDELARMSDDDLLKILPNISVIARSLPSDKARLVKAAQAIGYVCGMTGDGVNDASALKASDIGFAMGSGTEVAKEAGDIVILNNDISAIVKSVLYGRTIFKSIRKFIVFQLTMNLCAVSVTILGPFVGVDLPITIVQMLWVNIIMDTLGGLAFAAEPAIEDTLKERPKRREEPILTKYMIGQICYMGMCTLIICVCFMALEHVREAFGFYSTPSYFYASFFCLFIFLGIVNCFLARTPRMNVFAHIEKNSTFVIIMCIISAVQLIMVYFGGELFRGAPLSLLDLCKIILISLLVFAFDMIRRIIIKTRKTKIESGM